MNTLLDARMQEQLIGDHEDAVNDEVYEIRKQLQDEAKGDEIEPDKTSVFDR